MQLPGWEFMEETVVSAPPLLKVHGIFSNHNGQDFKVYFNYCETLCTINTGGE